MTQSHCLPELPKPYTTAKELVGIGERDFFTADQMNAHFLKGYEAGSAAAAQTAWQPIGWQFRFVFPTHASNWHTVLRLPVTDMHSGDDYHYETRLVYVAAPTQGAEGAAPQAEATDQDFLADVYEQCCEAIKPAVDRGLLPGSVVESLQMLVAEKLAAPQAVVGEASESALGPLDQLP